MFLRTVTKKNDKRYHYLLKSVRKKGKTHPVQVRVADLTGLPENIIQVIGAMLKGKDVTIHQSASKLVRVLSTRYFAPLWIAIHFWLDLKVSSLSFFTKKEFKNLTALVLARTVEPLKCRSELRTESWLRKSALHHILGGGPNQWDRDEFYPLLTKLTQNWDKLEEHLWNQRSSVPRLYLYDITSTYFEGKGGLYAALGYSRDEKRSNPQLVLALVADQDGLPIALRILPGNTKDSTTVKDTITDLKNRFGAQKAVMIMDRGMNTEENLEELQGSELDYILALPHKRAREFLLSHNQDLQWDLFDQRHIAEWVEKNKRYILCRNPNVAHRDRNTRERILGRAIERLEKLKNMVKKGRIKNRDKILVRVVKILTQTKTEKYFQYKVETGQFSYEQTDLTQLLELYEGCYVLETSLKEPTTKEEIDQAYRNQREIEEVFKSCKDELHLRPNFHKKNDNIFGHIYLTFLAHLVKKRLELKLKTNACTEKGSSFLSAFSEITVNRIEINSQNQDVITELIPKQSKKASLAGVTIPTGPIHRSLRSYLPKYLQRILI